MYSIPQGGILAKIPQGGILAKIPQGGILAKIPQAAKIPQGRILAKIHQQGMLAKIPQQGTFEDTSAMCLNEDTSAMYLRRYISNVTSKIPQHRFLSEDTSDIRVCQFYTLKIHL